MVYKKEYVRNILSPNSHVFKHMVDVKEVLSRIRYTPSTKDKKIVGAIDEYIMITKQLEEIMNDNMEVESEFEVYVSSLDDKVERANELLRFEMCGAKPMFYYYDGEKIRCPVDDMYWVLFQQCLHDKGVNPKQSGNLLLRFLKRGMMAVKHI